MRRMLLGSAALFSVAVAALAVAQTTLAPPPEPGGSETVAPSSPNSEPATGKPVESVAPGAGTSDGAANSEAAPAGEPATGKPAESAGPNGRTIGGTGNTQQATPAGPASGPIGKPTPSGATQEHTTSPPVSNKHVEHEPPAAEKHPPRHAAHRFRAAETRASAAERPGRHGLTAPDVTTSSADEHVSTDQYLGDAQTAIHERRIGKALEALERAETRALNSGANSDVGQNSRVDTIERAREALGHVRYLRPDPAQAGQLIDQALSKTDTNGTSFLFQRQ